MASQSQAKSRQCDQFSRGCARPWRGGWCLRLGDIPSGVPAGGRGPGKVRGVASLPVCRSLHGLFTSGPKSAPIETMLTWVPLLLALETLVGRKGQVLRGELMGVVINGSRGTLAAADAVSSPILLSPVVNPTSTSGLS
jgi:hypothetical protein